MSGAGTLTEQYELQRALDAAEERANTEAAGNAMPRGFPRPRLTAPGFETLPAPYVAASVSQPAALDFDRARETEERFLCMVCGLEVTGDRCGISTGVAAPGVADERLDVEMDHGLTHPACARMTAMMCPAFRSDYAHAPMAMWMVDTASLRAVWDKLDDGLTLGMLTGRERVG
ncbi:hypothetical protein [Microbacterium sp. 77mftsu3.1]|uniref:hypothetical protein n=1 Tax=Microbacterium sp. 77mftsu3.1 TaxID=1761802 RepID=UPI000369030E|nr:hypothetical protein [Microbacterium sp. 77mftsu3.1]SDH40801.1 hypothetical protein SAMN04488590_3264 [Microbacterium sp. 77mftsu3.1]